MTLIETPNAPLLFGDAKGFVEAEYIILTCAFAYEVEGRHDWYKSLMQRTMWVHTLKGICPQLSMSTLTVTSSFTAHASCCLH